VRRLADFFIGGFGAVFLAARATVEALRRGILDNQFSITNPGIAKTGRYIYIPHNGEATTNLLLEDEHTTVDVIFYQCRMVK
jgi:hypothetical protein